MSQIQHFFGGHFLVVASKFLVNGECLVNLESLISVGMK